MSDGLHLLVPFAASEAPQARAALAALHLPHLERLLARLAPEPALDDGEQALSMPHEHVLADALGLPGSDGLRPWAAWQVLQAGGEPGPDGWAWITPCHWRLGTDHGVMHHPQDLRLDAQESQALLAAIRPYFEEDGIQLRYDGPTRWLARGALFATLPTASLDRVIGRVIHPWMARGDAGRPLRRLQQEMQMLLYTHPVNEERSRGGLLPVNSFWASGTGALPSPTTAREPDGLQVTHALRDMALLADWNGWSSAWQQLDAKDCVRLQAAVDAGRSVALTLCGERRARTWRSAGSGWARRMAALWSRPKAAESLADL
ncbi:MAG: phosphoglycerate mutase [Ramlibacter sp.]